MEVADYPELSRSTPSNTYDNQIKRTIRELVTTGQLPRGSYIPGERALAAHWGVTRQTVRRALDGLSDILRAQQGSGRQVIP